MVFTPDFFIAAGTVLVGTNAVAMSGAEFSGDLLESDVSLELRDAAINFFLFVCW